MATTTIGGVTSSDSPTSATSGTEVEAVNAGNGVGLYADTYQNGRKDVIVLKSLVPGLGVDITEDDTTITISTNTLSPGLVSLFSLVETGATSVTPHGLMYGRADGQIDFLEPVTDGSVLACDGDGLYWTLKQTVGVAPIVATTTGETTTISMANSGVTAGTYENPVVTVNNKGIVTDVQSQPYPKFTVYLIATLPDPVVAGEGSYAYCGDSRGPNAPSFVYSDGTVWRRVEDHTAL